MLRDDYTPESDEERDSRIHEEQENKTIKFFDTLKHCNEYYRKWLARDSWSLREAINLSIGFVGELDLPTSTSGSFIGGYCIYYPNSDVSITAFKELEAEALRALIVDAFEFKTTLYVLKIKQELARNDDGNHIESSWVNEIYVKPIDFINWAITKGIKGFPIELEKLCTKKIARNKNDNKKAEGRCVELLNAFCKDNQVTSKEECFSKLKQKLVEEFSFIQHWNHRNRSFDRAWKTTPKHWQNSGRRKGMKANNPPVNS